GDMILYFGLDWEGEVTHTPTGVLVEDMEGTHINARGVVIGHFLATGTSHTGGWTSGNLMTGFAMAMIPAAGSTDATATPTGVAGTGAVGSPTIITSVTLVPTGVSGTGAVGDPTVVTGQLVI